MKTYSVEITETLQRTIQVEANSSEDAEDIVNEQWYKSEQILDAEDFKGVSFAVISEPKNKGYER